MITGLTDPKIWGEIEKTKPFAFFKKPVPIPDFLESVARALGPVSESISTVEETGTNGENQDLESQFHILKRK